MEMWMSPSSRSFAMRVSWLTVMLAIAGVFAEASSDAYPLQIKVLSSEYLPLDSGTPVPKDCDMQNFSAYCNESRNPTVQNVMRVQAVDGETFTIACTVDSRWSKCEALPVGETFEARKDKHGLTVLYRNAKGKEKKQLYQLMAAAPMPPAGAAMQPANSPRKAAPSVTGSTGNGSATGVPAPASVATPVNAPVAARQAAVESGEKVRCNFSSTPAGAEITLDGKYVGNTPSEIAVRAGSHTVVYSLPGFTEWKRDLTVMAGSELTVSGILQKP
jgi:hypothetical protein